MRSRNFAAWRTRIVPLLLVLAVGLTACGGGSASGSDRPTVTVGSFNFPESVILAEIYAQALEAADIPVGREFDLGAREFIYPELESGEIDLLPEYVASALAVGFEGEPTADTAASVEALRQELEAIGATALEPAEAQNSNVFAVTSAFAEEHGLTNVSDLAGAGDLVLAGPPECEDRQTCYAGLLETYGFDNVAFQTIQETTVRVESLANGEIDVALLFSTDPAIAERDFVALEDDQGLVASENIVPVITQDVLDAYGDELSSVLDAISSLLTTEALIDMNGQSNAGDDAADIAQQWLSDNGLT